jgi:hypothetical protein
MAEKFRKMTRQDLQSVHRDIRDLILSAQDKGALSRRTKKGHIMLKFPPLGTTTTVPGTPSDHRSIPNCEANMRKLFLGPQLEVEVSEQSDPRPKSVKKRHG